MSLAFYVCEYDRSGKYLGAISGLGRNKNTLDASHSRRAANIHAARLRRKYPKRIFKVETNGITL